MDKKLLSAFVAESNSLLFRYEQILLQGEKEQNMREKTGELMRIMHTIKGNARTAGFSQVSFIAAKQEELLHSFPVCEMDDLLKGVDAIQKHLPRNHQTDYRIRIVLQRSLTEVKSQVGKLLAELQKYARILPGSEEIPQQADVPFELVLRTSVDPADLTLVLQIPDIVQSISIVPYEQKQLYQEEQIRSSEWSRLIEELAVYELSTKNAYQYLSHTNTKWQLAAIEFKNLQQDIEFLFSRDHVSPSLFRSVQERTRETVAQLYDLHTSVKMDGDIETLHNLGYFLEDTKKLFLENRMISLNTLFRQFSRSIRDMARELKKEVIFSTKGGEVKIDHSMAKSVIDILTHCLRNAVAHGIEYPEHRIREGKPRKGRIILEARSEATMVTISITDDGAGIDTKRLYQKAVSAGFISSDSQYSEEEIHQLLFKEGLSTSDQATHVSGRGVGMSFVNTRVSSLLGSIDIYSQRLKGTHITVYLPFSLTVSYGVHVQSQSCKYIIPETIVIGSQRSQTTAPYPVHSIESLMGYPSRDMSSYRYHLIVGNKNHRIALAVDDLVGYEGYTIKPIFLPSFEFIQGVALTLHRSIAFLVSTKIIFAAFDKTKGVHP